MVTSGKRKCRLISGFTLIELMLVVAVIAVLSAIAVPKFMSFQAKSRQSEARALLGGIWTAQESYFAVEEAYGTFADIGYTPAAVPKFYSNLAITALYTDAWSAGASANIDTDATIDVWVVDETTRKPVNSTNDVKI